MNVLKEYYLWHMGHQLINELKNNLYRNNEVKFPVILYYMNFD